MLYSLHKKAHSSFDLESMMIDLRQIISHRLQSHFNNNPFHWDTFITEKYDDNLIKEDLIKHLPQKPTNNEWIILITALMPHLQPNFFESIIAELLPNGGDFPEFGGVKAANHRSLLPTGETIQFILSGINMEDRLQVQRYFTEDHFFFSHNILWLEPIKEGEPKMSGRIILSQDWVDKLLLNKETNPRFGLDFPAKRLTTGMVWDDAVLNNQTMTQVNEISNWLKYHYLFDEDDNLKRKIKPGFRVLFHGPAGTGKTMTAVLLGKQFEKDVYRIDLSQIVSKYIGETEKNLENVFRKAENKNWILFFDEADALFGKRTSVQSAHDKYANQEVSYLLQRVEDFPGLLILASNLKNNLDEAFLRRFHSLIHFPMPNSTERLILWKKTMPSILKCDKSVNLEALAKQYELSGSSILNAIQFAALETFSRKDNMIYQKDFLAGIRKEYLKEDKTF